MPKRLLTVHFCIAYS